MKKLKFILVVMFGLSFSIEAFSEFDQTVDQRKVSDQERHRGPDMNQFEADEEGFQAEVTFEEEEGIDITSEDLDSAFSDALASR